MITGEDDEGRSRMTLATRAELRTTIEASYSCLLHVVTVHAIPIAAMTGAALLLREPRSTDLLAIPAALVVANTAEYFLHRYPMHHRTPGLGFLFERHTVAHHAYFRSDSMQIDDARDIRYVMFAPIAAVMAVALAAALAGLVALAFGRNVGLLFGAGALFYYLLYEWFHASFHLFRMEQLERIPILGRAARRHRIHHDSTRMGEANFNITWGLLDRILGTAADT